MRIYAAEDVNGTLVLTMPRADIRNFLWHFKPGEYEIKRTVKRRSLSANAYAWSLIGQIARKMSIPEEEVYRHCIENIAGHTESMTIAKKALSAFRRAFVDDHIGRKVEKIGEDDYTGTVDILVTYGSSDYDSRQMSELIDSIVQECKALEIPTLEDERIAKIIEDWEKSHG